MAKRNTSSSDLTNRKPVSGAKNSGKSTSAAAKGAHGAATAAVFIKAADDSARNAIKAQTTMKERLLSLVPFTKEDHMEFRAALEAQKTAYKAAADAKKISVQDYFKSGDEGRIAAIVQTTVSMWQKMSLAVQAGWKPDTSKVWAELSKEATNYKASTGQGHAPTTPKTDTEIAAARAAEAGKMVTKFKTMASSLMLDKDGAVTETAKSALPDVVFTVCQHASVDELQAVIARLENMIEARKASDSAAKKALDKAADGPAPTGNVGNKITDESIAAAQASTRKGRGKTPANA